MKAECDSTIDVPIQELLNNMGHYVNLGKATCFLAKISSDVFDSNVCVSDICVSDVCVSDKNGLYRQDVETVWQISSCRQLLSAICHRCSFH